MDMSQTCQTHVGSKACLFRMLTGGMLYVRGMKRKALFL